MAEHIHRGTRRSQSENWVLSGPIADRFVYSVDPDAPRSARRFVAASLEEAGYAGDVSLVELLVSEFVNNSIQHGREPFELRVEMVDGTAFVAVDDGDPECVPVRRSLEGTGAGVGGRGLVIADALADEWGCEVRPGEGKTVWFRLAPS